MLFVPKEEFARLCPTPTLASASVLLSLQFVRTPSSSFDNCSMRPTSACSMRSIILSVSRALVDADSSRISVSSTTRACSWASILRDMASYNVLIERNGGGSGAI